jgi:hypothetical protein
MSYSHLPLSERMEKASEYALLLSGDLRPQEEIVAELQEMFDLTQDEAIGAIARMRRNYSKEYNKSYKESIRHGMASVFMGLVCGGFYFAMGKEVAGPVMILGIFFFLVGVGAVIFMLKKTEERFFFSIKAIRRKVSGAGNEEEEDHPRRRKIDPRGANLIVGIFFLLLAGACHRYYTKDGIIEPVQVSRVDKLVVFKPASRQSTGGRSARVYFLFLFEGHANEFRFYESYYEYAGKNADLGRYRKGDSLSVELLHEDAALMRAGSPEDISIVNIIQNGRRLYDYEARNRAISKQNFSFIVYASLFFAGALILRIVVHQQERKHGHATKTPSTANDQ